MRGAEGQPESCCGGKSSYGRTAGKQGCPAQLGAALPSSAGELSPLAQEPTA